MAADGAGPWVPLPLRPLRPGDRAPRGGEGTVTALGVALLLVGVVFGVIAARMRLHVRSAGLTILAALLVGVGPSTVLGGTP